MLTRDRVVAEVRLHGSRDRMITAWMARRLARRAARHVRDGLPEPAVYAFDWVGRSISLWGRYERDELALLMQSIVGQVQPGGIALDIGANIGNHALALAPAFDEVWAFEPNPRALALLRINAALRTNVRCFDFGLSDRAGSVALTVPAGNLGMGRIGIAPAPGDHTVACELRRLDDLAELGQRRVALVKIDVEGHEAAVLRGGLELLRRDRPLVVLEQAADEIDADGESPALAVLRSAGYDRWWVIEAYPHGPWRLWNLVRRLVGREGLRMVECTRLPRRFHSMVVALPGPR